MDQKLSSLPMTRGTTIPFSLPSWIALAPFEEYLSMSIISVADGNAVLTMPFYASHCQGQGLMHGGAITALADTALAMAIKSLLPEGTPFATMTMTTDFNAPVRWGTVTATARVGERVDRDIRGDVEIVTEEGVTAARFRATFRIRRSAL